MKRLINSWIILSLVLIVGGVSFAADTSRDQVKPFLAQPDRFSDIYKTEILSSDNHRVGKFQDFVLESSGKVSYLILAHGGLLGIGEKMIPIPWDFVSKNAKFDTNKKEYVLNLTKDQLTNAPNFEQKNLPNFASDDFAKSINEYYQKAGSNTAGQKR
jgi:sporulation protein YlmC with PRC-barrel domain